MKTSKGITLGAFSLITLAAVSGFMHSAVAAGVGYSDMKDARDEMAARQKQAQSQMKLSKNFANEVCDDGKVWIAHGLDNVDTNGELDVSEIVDYTCERVYTKIKAISAWSLSKCIGQGGVLVTEWYDANGNGRVESYEVTSKQVVCHAPSNVRHEKPMP